MRDGVMAEGGEGRSLGVEGGRCVVMGELGGGGGWWGGVAVGNGGGVGVGLVMWCCWGVVCCGVGEFLWVWGLRRVDWASVGYGIYLHEDGRILREKEWKDYSRRLPEVPLSPSLWDFLGTTAPPEDRLF
ncbi:hypothetical protein Tco_1343232 [Tanacetum coccineum]